MQRPTACSAFWVQHRTRENIGVPHWGSYNPCKGRVLEWRLRMYGMYHHSAWDSFALPPQQWRTQAAQLTFYPRIRCKRAISNCNKGQITNFQIKGHWQVHYRKPLALCPRRTPPCSARSHKTGKRIKSSCSTCHRTSLTLNAAQTPKSNWTCPKLPPW
jgi:hypothetical protein